MTKGKEESDRALEIAKTIIQTASQFEELSRQLLLEEYAVSMATEAMSALLTGEFEADIVLDANSSSMLLDALDPINIPGLKISRVWIKIADHGIAFNSGPLSGIELVKVVYNGIESYLLKTLKEERAEKIVISKQPTTKPS